MSKREWNRRCISWIKSYMECLFENRSVELITHRVTCIAGRSVMLIRQSGQPLVACGTGMLHNVKQRDLFGIYP